MRLVIDISNYDMEWINNAQCIPDILNEKIADVIINGTLLPEGHGQLIDRDNLLRTLNEEHIKYDSDVNYFICHAPVIVEVDKEVE